MGFCLLRLKDKLRRERKSLLSPLLLSSLHSRAKAGGERREAEAEEERAHTGEVDQERSK